MSANVPRTADPVSPMVQRLVAASGIVFAILLVVSISLTGEGTPDDGAPLAEWTEYARDNEDNLRIAALLFGLAAYSFLLFLGYLRSVMGDAERAARGFTRGGYIVLAAGTAGIVGMAVGIGANAAAMSHPDTPPEILRAISDIGGGGFLAAAAGFGACLVTVGLLNAGLRALPAWLGWVALGAGISFVLQLGVLLDSEQDNVFGIFYPIGFLLLVVFCVGASVTFLRERPPEPAPAA
jgi:hypothetical protein